VTVSHDIDILQGSVATHLRCGVAVSLHIFSWFW